MKKIILLVLTVSTLCVGQQNANTKLDWWKEARFGMFIHWGLYSYAAGDWNGHKSKGNEHFMLYEKIPVAQYMEQAKLFNPTQFNADEWVSVAKQAGMKYIVITSKHHDGFAMYDSPNSEYNIVKMSPFKRDPMKELAAACQKYDVKLCFYYSLGRDWQDPDVPTNWPTKGGRSNTWDYPNEDGKVFHNYFERKVKPQIKELLTQYGPIGVIWFDTPELISKAESEELVKLINELQPNCLINERVGNKLGDFLVSEQKLNAEATTKPWESCITISQGWGYNKYDTKYKSPELLVRNLIEVVSKNGNFLLNVGPTGEGKLTNEAVQNLGVLGNWMKTNAEAIYGTTSWNQSGKYLNEVPKQEKPEATDKNTMKDAINDATSKLTPQDIRFTQKGEKTLYLFARSWKDTEVTVNGFTKADFKVKKVSLLGNNSKLDWKQTESGLTILLPTTIKTEIPIYVFKLE